MNFGEIIKKCRKYRGLTLKQLATKSGVSEGALSNWETNKCDPSIYNYESVLNAMGFRLEITVKEK